MYYLELIQRFWDFNQKAQLNTTAIAMYLYLLKLGHDNNGYHIIVSDAAISNALGITRKTVKPTKDKLRNLGLIQFQNGKGLPCSYRILLNYSFECKDPEKQKIKSNNEFHAPILEKIENSQSDSLPIQNNSKTSVLKDEKVHNNKPKHFKSNQPSWKEFIEYAQTLENYTSQLDFSIEEKYEIWKNNGWKNTSKLPITNWKSTLKSTLPYLLNPKENSSFSLQDIPNIKRPEPKSKNQ